MTTVTSICPYTNSCILYKNWNKKTNDERVNIIFYNTNRYSCLAFEAHNDSTSEGGITFNEEIKKRIVDINVEKNLNLGNVECSHITLLNKLK
jgi:hypothetical protein